MQPLDVLRAEHASIRMLLGMLEAAANPREATSRPPALRSILTYLEAFIETVHRPKEDNHLFRKVGARAPGARTLLSELYLEHYSGARSLRLLEQSIPRSGAAQLARDDLLTVVQPFRDSYAAHMEREERELFPLALETLLPEDWQQLGEIYATSIDPLRGSENPRDLETLLRRIEASWDALVRNRASGYPFD